MPGQQATQRDGGGPLRDPLPTGRQTCLCRKPSTPFIKAFGSIGFTACGNANIEHGYEKVALYVDENGKPTHAARQLSSGRWTSKLGKIQDIEHELDGLTGEVYGVVAQVLKRPIDE